MGIFSETLMISIILSPIWFYSSSLLETLIIAMFSYFRSAGDKIVETFQDLGYFERNEISNVKAKKIPGLELGSSSKNLKDSMVSSSSESRTTTTAIEDIQKKPLIAIQCRRCLSDSSPVVIVNPCDHRFCVNCILFLWSLQKQREPCVCPLDGEKIIWLRPPMLDEPEEISGLVDIYNPLFNPYHIMDMAEAQLVRTFTRFYCADLTLTILGAIAYYFKISKSKASGT